jgi:uncharacterized membrane-anchored protein YhcB (DUF1043 family)
MLDTLIWVAGALLAVAGMIIGALKVGESRGRQKVEHELEKANVENERRRDDVEDRIRRHAGDGSDPDKLRTPYDRD